MIHLKTSNKDILVHCSCCDEVVWWSDIQSHKYGANYWAIDKKYHAGISVGDTPSVILGNFRKFGIGIIGDPDSERYKRRR